MNFIKLESIEDASVNYVKNIGIGENFESRYVRRVKDYFICYISSQTGCSHACRFCHLTATGQNKARDATFDEMIEQTTPVMERYKESGEEARYMHFNFMARGEPLSSVEILLNNRKLFNNLEGISHEAGLEYCKINISTILPRNIEDLELTDIFHYNRPRIYYSLYSLDPKFRKRWIPRSIDPILGLEKLKQYQENGGEVKIHHAFIKNENDSIEQVVDICDTIKRIGLKPNFNIVRYNPYSSAQGEESHEDVIHRNVEIINNILGTNIKIVPKVGYDVKASCGMFVDK